MDVHSETFPRQDIKGCNYSGEVVQVARPRPGIKKSVGGAILLIFWDAVLEGTCLTSLVICPIWFLVSIIKNSIQRPGWKIALLRIAIPILVFVLVRANDDIQRGIAKENADHVVAACEAFYDANGSYPKTLQDLVPKYLPYVPRAKYCLVYGNFWYMYNQDDPMLLWWSIPMCAKNVYFFGERHWRNFD